MLVILLLPLKDRCRLIKWCQGQDTCSRNPAGSGSTESTMFNSSLFAVGRPGPCFWRDKKNSKFKENKNKKSWNNSAAELFISKDLIVSWLPCLFLLSSITRRWILDHLNKLLQWFRVSRLCSKLKLKLVNRGDGKKCRETQTYKYKPLPKHQQDCEALK